VARRVRDADPADVVEVRRAFEVEAARSAALRRTPEDIAALERALAERDAAWLAGDAEAFVEADVTLHQAVVAAAHNRVLADLYADFSAALRASVADAVGPDLTPDRHVDHGHLVDAIRSGDPIRAAAEAAAFLERPR
jgi:DNA-binding FadR family transcriptional regulator